MKRYFERIREQTRNMTGSQKAAYIFTYYWYHMLGVAAAVGLMIFLVVHFGFAEPKPEFTCVLVNQAIDSRRDQELLQDFAKSSQIPADRMVFDSDYNISYGEVQLEGVNESSYEKFFFKWRNKELDAVILPESFYQFCREMGGTCRDITELGGDGLPLYEDEGKATGILVEQTKLEKYLNRDTGERLLLVFPDNGKQEENCKKFCEYLTDRKE